ncbi:MAG: hypothetical protein AAF433_22830 [Bacteroidota bacterium]
MIAKPNYFFAAFLILGFFFTSCVREEIIEVEVPVATIKPDYKELYRSSDPNRRIYQMFRFGDELLLQGENVHFYYTLEGTGRGQITRNRSQSVEAFTEVICADINPVYQRMKIVATRDGARLANTQFSLSLTSVLPEGFQLPRSIDFRKSFLSLSEDDYVMVPFKLENDPRLRVGIGKLAVQEDYLWAGGIELLSWENYLIDSVADLSLTSSGQTMTAVEGGFLVNAITGFEGPRTYRVDFEGSFEPVYDGIVNYFFEYKGERYAFGYRSNSLDFSIHRLSSDGRIWTEVYQIYNSVSTNTFYRCFPTEDHLLILQTTTSRVFTLTDLDENATISAALDTEELEDYVITDIERLGDFAYISTLSGFFRRPWQEFINSREGE